jgi:hypothetical protein
MLKRIARPAMGASLALAITADVAPALPLEAAEKRHVGSNPKVTNYDTDLWATNLRFSAGPVSPTLRLIYSMTIAPMSRAVRSGGRG